MRKYTSKVEEPDEDSWKVMLIDYDTKKPFTWTFLEKTEFPTKDDAIKHLVGRYENEIGDYDERVAHTKGMIPMRMMTDYTDRKKKSKKSKVKRKTKKCRCK